MPGWVQPFDVRAVGLLHLADFRGETTFIDLHGYLTTRRFVEVLEEKQGLYRLSWLEDEGAVRAWLWLDEKKGFSPTRMETRYQALDSEKAQLGRLIDVSETTWIEMSGVVVPRSFRLQDGFEVYELTLDWEAVNQGVSEQLFTPEGFNLEQGTYIVNDRLGKPIVTGRVGDDSFSPSTDIGEEENLKSRRWFFMLGVVAVLLLGAIILWTLRQLWHKPVKN
jgi:hypothetical protein